MRAIKTAMTTLLVSGLASFAYAQLPVPEAAHIPAALIAAPALASTARQEKPKDAPEAKPSKAEKQEMPKEDKKAQKADQKKDKDQSMKADKKQDKKEARQDQKADKNGAGEHGKIKDKDYKAHFGQEHKFSAKRVITTTHIVPNETRFVYTWYTFVFLQPWPMGWGFDDDVYIDYMDGAYYMYDVEHPGVQLGLSIAF